MTVKIFDTQNNLPRIKCSAKKLQRKINLLCKKLCVAEGNTGKEKKVMLERVKEIIEEQLNLENVEITEETRFKEDLEVDSLDLFELVMAFEEEYGVEIPSEDLEKITTVGAVIKYMQDKGVNA